jgi:hypothetical protein
VTSGTVSSVDTASDLREWARGSYGLVAAVELLIRSFDGQFADSGYPWIKWDTDRTPGRWWLDADALNLARGVSSGEGVILDFVAALAGKDWHFDLTDIARLDRRHQGLVLAAIAHAGGSYEHQVAVFNAEHTAIIGRERPGSLYPWPEDGG